MTQRNHEAVRLELANASPRLRLAKLIVQGFKSFADRIEFEFDQPITGVVGPNGCGKSNVVDAVKWVLGEQSAKSLRGGAMMDVIFNGSADRKPASFAEVTLVFDNPLNADDPDGKRFLHVDTEQTSVTRILFRDGTSKYKINGKNARLKDTRDLFLDTGVGVDAYSVIEQGRVAQMLDANPAERRLIFEEAAGISRFKQRKKEATRKLEKVDANLLRLHDITEEVEKQLRSVKMQAGKARNYKELTARLAELRLAHALNEYAGHVEKLEAFAKKREEATFRRDDLAGGLRTAEQQRDAKRQEAEELSAARQKTEHEKVQQQAKLDRARQAQRFAENQLAELDRQAQTIADDLAAASTKREKNAADLQTSELELTEVGRLLAERRAEIDGKSDAHRAAQNRQNELDRQIAEDRAAINSLTGDINRAENRLSNIEVERRNHEAQRERLEARRGVVEAELAEAEAAAEAIRVELEAVEAEHAEQQAQAEAVRAQSAQLGEQIGELSAEIARHREHRSGLASRRKVLDDLEAHHEGVSEAVQSVLERRESDFPFIRGLVADILRVDVEHALPIEAALFGRDQWLIASDAAAAAEHAEAFAQLPGRVNVIRPNGWTPPAEVDWSAFPQRVRLALDLVRVEPDDRRIAERLLGTTAVVRTVAEALALHDNGPNGWRYVTAQGEVLEADGTLRVGPMNASAGLISRRSELDALANQIADADRHIDELVGRLERDNAEAKQLEGELATLRQASYETNGRKVELTSKRSRTGDQITALQSEQPVLAGELEKITASATQLDTDEQTQSALRDKLIADRDTRLANVEGRGTDLAAAGAEVAELAEMLTAARVALSQVQQRQLAAREATERMKGIDRELAAQVERLQKSQSTAGERRTAAEAELAEATKHQSEADAIIGGLAARVTELGEQLTAAREAVETHEHGAMDLRERLADVDQQLRDLELKQNDRNVRLESLVQRTAEEAEIDLPVEYERREADEDDDTDWAAIAAEIKDLRGRVARLGNVNLDAIEDQENLEARAAELAEQVADLEEGKAALVELIAELNTESGKRFEQTFEIVREEFQGMFRKLFGGGKADLFLETELEDKKAVRPDGDPTTGPIMKRVDPLDAGIEIIARPPGKQPASISQLSGGEKTMTCIALLMAIFKSKPSPFCILDEVDAALDEANNVRFNGIIEAFLDRSQFIVITHSKRTMQIADVLYGVTMQQKGVSKKVAVKFDQVGNEGEIAKEAALA